MFEMLLLKAISILCFSLYIVSYNLIYYLVKIIVLVHCTSSLLVNMSHIVYEEIIQNVFNTN